MRMLDLSEHRQGLNPSMWYPPYCLLFSTWKESYEALERGLIAPRHQGGSYEFSTHVRDWLTAIVGREGTDWATVGSSDASHYVRVYFERKADAMLFRLTFD